MLSRVRVSRCNLCAAVLGLSFLGWLVFAGPPASAEVVHNYLSRITEVPASSGAPITGRFSNEVRALGLDGSGDLYVVDPLNRVIDEFSPSGSFLSQFGAGGSYHGEVGSSVAANTAGSEVYYAEDGSEVAVFSAAGHLLEEWKGEDTPSGSFSGALVAVDRSTSLSDPAAGDVYVANRFGNAVDVFKPEAGGKEEYVTQLTGEGAPSEPFQPINVTVDEANGDVLVVINSSIIADRYSYAVDVFAPTALGGYEYVRQITGPSGGSFGEFGDVTGVAEEGSSEGNIYVSEYGENETDAHPATGGTVYEFSATGALLTRIKGTPSSAFSQHVGGVAVTGSGDVYVADEYGQAVDVFGPNVVLPDVAIGAVSNLQPRSVTLNGTVNPDAVGNATCRFEYGTSTAYGQSVACSKEVPSGSSPVAVSGEASGLQPGTTYHFRLDASNTHGTDTGQESGEFTTLGPGVGNESVVDVASSSATLQAQVDPHGADTHYYFQYGTSASYGSDAPVPPGTDIGSESGEQSVSVPLQGLQPSAVYHYRVVASNEVTTAEGPDQTFTTQAPGGTLTLPDGRDWELVSPVGKLGAQVAPQRGLIQASEDGGAIAYPMGAPFVANPPGNVQVSDALSRRGSGGWSTEDIATPHTEPASFFAYGEEYQLFSPDLLHALVDPLGETPLSPEATEETPYLRDDDTATCEPPPKTCYTPLVDPADVPPGTKFGSEEKPGEVVLERGPRLVAATPDLSHVVLHSNVLGEVEWSVGRLQNVPVPVGNQNNVRRAISDDGLRIFGNGTVTDMTDGEVLHVGGEFQIASSDGSLVFSSSGSGLYVYDVETGKLTLVTVAVNSGEEPGVQGLVLGASEDGSYVYLVAKGLLTEASNAEQAKAVAGADNLYVLHREARGSVEAWKPSFIATLSADDELDWEPPGRNIKELEMARQTAEVSPNGRYLAFMSDRSLTGYDNRDVSSGEPDEEVYRYDAANAGLVCASCDPTGARPVGWLEPLEAYSDIAEAWVGRWVAGTIPGPIGVFNERTFYEPRYMLDNGRLFFDSRDALVPQDVNGVDDVYEYEPGGEGSCAAANSGCVALLSDGTGAKESAFMDASASGNDVFFVTADRLAPQDVDTAYDMYDAHVCSVEAPCSSSVVASPPCTTADSCRGAQAPQPGVFGAPASATFNGAGNLSPTTTGTVKPKKTTASAVKAEKLAKVLKACRKMPKKKRPTCEKRARAQYAPTKKKGK